MTVATASARPLYLEGPAGPIFGMFHPTRDGLDPGGVAVLIVPPWGWDETASYTGRRAWADSLADAGHPTLRIDLPGTGESGGTAGDPGLVAAWIDAITTAASWLAAVPGVSAVAAIGLGLGGLLTAAAIGCGARIDDLVLWSAPVRGRTFLREQRAFSALQDTRLGRAGEPAPDGLPEGWLESGGFVLSADTIADLGSLEMATMSFEGLRRALLLERDGIPNDGALEAELRVAGVDVTTAPAPGWTGLVFHPEQYDPPVQVFGRVAGWLAEATPSHARTTGIEPPTVVDTSEMLEGGVRIRESPIPIEQSFGTLFGVLGEPVDGPVSAVTAVFLNAGAVRRIGPDRLWVETSRRWNARGLATIRVDLEGIGDADGDPARYRDVGNFYTPEIGRQVSSIVDELERRGFGPRFVLIGLCAGGYWAFHTARRRPPGGRSHHPESAGDDLGPGPADASRGEGRSTPDRASPLDARPARTGPRDPHGGHLPCHGADRDQRGDDTAAAGRSGPTHAVGRHPGGRPPGRVARARDPRDPGIRGRRAGP